MNWKKPAWGIEMLETAVVINREWQPVHWHLPENRTAVDLPDSDTLWSVLWEGRDTLVGVAHTHPWRGTPRPSHTDLTTFAAIEAGLGLRLRWWIVTANRVRAFIWYGPGRLDYVPDLVAHEETTAWLRELREHSNIPAPTRRIVWRTP